MGLASALVWSERRARDLLQDEQKTGNRRVSPAVRSRNQRCKSKHGYQSGSPGPRLRGSQVTSLLLIRPIPTRIRTRTQTQTQRPERGPLPPSAAATTPRTAGANPAASAALVPHRRLLRLTHRNQTLPSRSGKLHSLSSLRFHARSFRRSQASRGEPSLGFCCWIGKFGSSIICGGGFMCGAIIAFDFCQGS